VKRASPRSRTEEGYLPERCRAPQEGRTPLVSALWSGGELDDAGRPTADRGHAVVVELLAVDGHVNLRNRVSVEG
jgi:hypothetical protein